MRHLEGSAAESICTSFSEQFFMRVKAETNRTASHKFAVDWSAATAMASIALPPPFRRLLLKIRTTPPCGQRPLILPHVNQRVKLFHQGDVLRRTCDVPSP